jgi:hypothetical protein
MGCVESGLQPLPTQCMGRNASREEELEKVTNCFADHKLVAGLSWHRKLFSANHLKDRKMALVSIVR